MKAMNLANSSTTHKRRELDFYPTPPDVTHALMEYLDMRPGVVWEPACGDGAMAEVIKDYGQEVISTDIRETGYGEGLVNFLTTEKKCDAIITNPPFNLSEQFILHALGQADVVAMLLKSQYWHSKKRSALFKNHPPDAVLALTWRPDFMGGERGGAPTMDVIWTVWVDGFYQTKYHVLERPA